MNLVNKKLRVYSKEHLEYLKNRKVKLFKIKFFQMLILFLFLLCWEIFAYLKWIDVFIVSCPSRIIKTLINLNASGQLWINVYYTVAETVVGFVLGTILGLLFAILIWYSDLIYEISEPYLVVLNALPKVALGPIIIVWLGAGMTSIILMALLVSVVVSTINILSGFRSIGKDSLILMKSFGANKFQILSKLVIPANITTIISTLKINVGMSLIGVITGEFLVSSKGVGYLIVYGGQVFKLDLVMAGIFILLVIASMMYMTVAKMENIYLKNKK